MCRAIKVQCIDWNRDGSEDIIGEFMTSVDEMRRAERQPIAWQVGYAY
jgi:hypothetical protein